MKQLSKHYRHDDSGDSIDPQIVHYLDEYYVQHLKNIHETNPKLLVVFSGGNAMGKTTVARKIEAKFKGVVLENDEIRRHLLSLMPDIAREELSKLIWLYTIDLYRRLGTITSNGLIVRDGVIDWYFDRILPIFEQANYPLFIISFDITREKAIELIKKRGNTLTAKEERLYQLLDDHEVHQKRFRQQYTPDVILTDDNVFNQDLVLDKLAQRLKDS